MELNNNNNDNKYCKNVFLQFLPQFSFVLEFSLVPRPFFRPHKNGLGTRLVRIEIGNKLKVKIFQMYVSDARTPMPSLYTKALPCLCDRDHMKCS